ncbi:uncharacterized protein LOC100901000 [Galendromus occidentalis]|uniref:Uncharacterized protein LOC100901000 n=1 Tax=Galendromus occidentalis TaxID=34638 RepID=A0AAJ6QYU7_9ACAR|nr:uncharacterized protein LOC100901000 [Galendromus occidentalis]
MAPGTSSSLPPVHQMKRTVNYVRKNENLQNPRSMLSLEIPDEYKVDHEGNDFLLHDDGPNATNDRIIVFGSQECLQALKRNNLWLMDGTFRTAPQLFYQLYTFNVIENDFCYVALYCLLTSKQKRSYLRLLEIVKNLVGDDCGVRFAMVDFEIAYIQAFSEIFPEVDIHGCYYHFCQSVWRRIQSIPAVCKKYRSDANYSFNIKQLMALAFVPTERVYEYFEILINSKFFIDNVSELDELLQYFRKTWVGSRTANDQKRPIFVEELWNCYGSLQSDLPRTNNAVEAWHRGFDSLIMCCNPSIWKFIEAIKKDNSITKLRCDQLDAGFDRPRKRRCYKDVEKNLKVVAEKFGEKEAMSYIRAITRNIHF